MTSACSFTKLVCFWAAALLIGLPNSAYAQGKVLPRPTPQQIADFLKKDPTLSSGFQTPGKKATVRVVKPVRGGVLLRYESGDISGTVTVVGPVTTLDRDLLGAIIDGIVNYLTKLVGLNGAINCSTTTTTTTTTANGKTTTTTTTSTTCGPA